MNIVKGVLIALLSLAVVPAFASASQVTIWPDNHGNYTEWLNYGCGSGSNEWQCVDDAYNTSDFLYSYQNNSRESFSFQNVSLTTEGINSIKLYYYARYYNIYSKAIQPLIRVGGADYTGSLMNLSSSYVTYSQTFTTNPATNASWKISDINNLEAGMKTYSYKGGGYVASAYAIVDYYPTVPDLQIASLYSGGGNGTYVGDTIPIYVYTYNGGGNSTNTSTTRVEYGGASTEFSVPNLKYGSFQANSFNYTCMEPLTVVFVATADYYGTVSESNEGNNVKSYNMTCREKPDLTIEDISFSEYVQYVNGTNVTYVSVNTTVKNLGPGSSLATYTSLQGLSSNYTYTPAIGVNATYKINRNYACSSAHNFTATADYYAMEKETDETNNVMTTYIDCVL